MKEFLIKIITAFSLVVGSYFVNETIKFELQGAGVAILFILVIEVTFFGINNWSSLVFIIHSKYLAIKNETIRFSMSYQYLIKIDDKYLLVKNANPNWNWFQHVGGKYKRLPETKKILNDLEAFDDIKQPTSGLKKDDLAVFIPAKNAVKFLEWFDSNKEREVSHWREFYEELLGGKTNKPVITNTDVFPYVNYRLLKTVRTPIKRTPIESGWNCWELLSYDVLELIPTLEQKTELRKVKNSSTVKWVSGDLIDRLGYDPSRQKLSLSIGAHTKWIKNLKWTKE